MRHDATDSRRLASQREFRASRGGLFYASTSRRVPLVSSLSSGYHAAEYGSITRVEDRKTAGVVRHPSLSVPRMPEHKLGPRTYS